MLEIIVIGAVVCLWVTVLFLKGCKAQEMRIRETDLQSYISDN